MTIGEEVEYDARIPDIRIRSDLLCYIFGGAGPTNRAAGYDANGTCDATVGEAAGGRAEHGTRQTVRETVGEAECIAAETNRETAPADRNAGPADRETASADRNATPAYAETDGAANVESVETESSAELSSA